MLSIKRLTSINYFTTFFKVYMNSKKLNKVSIGISGLALLISLIIGVSQILQNKKINILTFNEHANEHRPMLRLVGTPTLVIKDVKVKVSPGVRKIVDITFAVERNYKFINDGNSDAFFLLYTCTDSLTNNPDFLRDFLLKENLSSNIDFRTKRLDGFFKTQVFKGDTLNLTIADSIYGTKKLLDVLTKEYISHLIIFYQNGEGILYDTNVMTKFDINQPLIGRGSTYIYWDKSMWHNSFIYKESVSNSKYYSQKQKTKLFRLYHKSFKKKEI